MENVKVYGADWCPMTTRSLRLLKEENVDFDYIDVEKDPAASEWVKAQNGGLEKKPTIQIGSEVLTEPSNAELDQALRRNGLL